MKISSTPSGKNRLTRLLPFLGPAFIASVASVDPGNREHQGAVAAVQGHSARRCGYQEQSV